MIPMSTIFGGEGHDPVLWCHIVVSLSGSLQAPISKVLSRSQKNQTQPAS